MTRLSNSWALAKVSWAVLRSDRTLAVIPAVSAVVSLLAVAAFAVLIALTGIDTGDGNGTGIEPITYVLGAVGYVVLAFVAVYFQSALVAGANARLDGRDATLAGSMQAASAKLHRILPWALVTATVSIIISQLERQGWIGAIIGNLLGMAWNVLTFLTVPIIVIEDVGPGTALRRSKDLFRSTWGENLTAQVGFGLIGLLAALPAIALVLLAAATGSGPLVVVAIVVAVAWVALVSVVLTALSGIFRTALYRFAVDGTSPPAFAGADLGASFTPKQGRTWI